MVECLTSLATDVISKKLEEAVDSIVEQFKYIIHHKKIIADLKEEHGNLKEIKEALEGRVDAARRSGQEIEPNVKKWLSEVEEIENKLERFYHRNEVKQKKKCFSEKCPNLALKYSLGKEATKSSEDITSLKEAETKFREISYPKPPPRLGSGFVADIKSIGSRNKIIAEVIDKLKDDKLKRISICGMGGVGKTTLAKEVIKVVDKEKLFGTVAMAAVSQIPNYEKIQNEIADSLGFTNFSSRSVEGRAREILQRLNEFDHKVLIVLDDVWGILEFEKIGLPSRDLQKGIKILFTSRNEKVCRDMGSQENFSVSILTPDEAWNLFREMAGDVVDKPDIYPIAKQVANECGGLPLAIVTVGRALEKNEEKSKWDVVNEELRSSKSSSSSDMQKFVYSSIELSFNLLDDQQKSCRFLCSLFPEDFDIPIESVLRYGVGLELFVGEIWKVRNEVNYNLVTNLRRCFLLLDSSEPGCVKMHDVVLKISFRSQDGIFVENKAELKRIKGKKWHRMSLALNEAIDDLENNGLEFQTTLELLRVWSTGQREPIPCPKNLIQGMTKLKVLALQNLCIPKMPCFSQPSFNLHTLQVEHCNIGDISIIGEQFKSLEILSFAYSSIKEIPTEIGQLKFLRLLDLTGCDDLGFIFANALARLSSLEELYFRIKNFPWNLNKTIFTELKNLSKQLKVLEFSIRKVEILPNDLNFKNLENFCFYVCPYLYHPIHFFESSKLHLRSTSYNSLKSSSMIINLVEKCEILTLEKVKDLKNVICELDITGLQYLKCLTVDSCPNLEYVVDCNTPCDAFPLIKSMSLVKLKELRKIFNASNPKLLMKFAYLEILKLEDLPNFIGFGYTIEYLNESYGLNSTTALADSIEVEDGKVLSRSTYSKAGGHKFSPIYGAKLFSSNSMEQFSKLKSISLKLCSSLNMVFDLQGYSQSDDHPLALLFPQLEETEISHLDNLTHVWGNVPKCVGGFQNLRSLTISSCDSLKYVFTPNIIRAMVNLEKLGVSSCKMMKNLVVWDEDEDSEEDNNKTKGQVNNIVFKKLYSVSLSDLPELESVCIDSSHKLEWPSLREFVIDGCPKLEISLSPTTNMQLKEHKLGDTYDPNTKDASFHKVKENHLGCFRWLLGHKPLLPKSISHRNTNEESNKQEGSLTQDKNSKIEKGQGAIVEDDMKGVQKDLKAKNTVILISSFSQLESLHLKSLPNLTRFCISGTDEFSNTQEDFGITTCEGDEGRRRRDRPLIDGSLFSNLTFLTVEGCDKIRKLFSFSSLKSLEGLQKLQVLHCKNIEEIVSQDQERETNENNKIMFHKLRSVLLEGLPNIRAFSQGSYHFVFPTLQEVSIKNSPNIEIFSRGTSHTRELHNVTMRFDELSISSKYCLRKKDLNSTIQGFKQFVALHGTDKLRWSELHNEGIFGYFLDLKDSRMNIREFNKISTVVGVNEMHVLQLERVRKLNIIDCDSLVEVFEVDGGVDKQHLQGDQATTTIQYELEEMYLSGLPKLRHIWKHNYMTGLVNHFGKLTSIEIRKCPSLKSLFSYSMARSLVQLERLYVSDCNRMEKIVTKEDHDKAADQGAVVVKLRFCFPN